MQRIALRRGPIAEMEAEFVQGGLVRRESLLGALPSDWSFAGKSVLDFGCGPGRLLRHFASEAATCSYSGCDIDAECIEWLSAHLSPPFKVFVNSEIPPLPVETGSLDLVVSTSVFTHLTDLWADWAVELHRVLKDGGFLFMTFLSPAVFGRLVSPPCTEDDVGLTMFEIKPDAEGGSRVLASEWWLRAHLSRAFEIVSLAPHGWGALPGRGLGQGMVLLRRKPGPITAADLLAQEPGEPREWASAQFNLAILRREVLALRATRAMSATPPPSAGRTLASKVLHTTRRTARRVRGAPEGTASS